MAEGQIMTVADVVAQVRDGRLEDFVKEAVALVARELMEAEISDEIAAGLRARRALRHALRSLAAPGDTAASPGRCASRIAPRGRQPARCCFSAA